MKLTVEPITLTLKTPFRIAHGTSTARDSVLIHLGDGIGEGSIMPYYGYTQAEVVAYLESLEPDILLGDVSAADYDVIVFVGGYPYDTDDPETHRIAQEAVAEGKLVAGICNAAIALAKAGGLKGKRATGSVYYPASMIEEEGASHTGALVERDGLSITANGPDASRRFGEAIAAALEE